jgi:hypothetical protein
MSEHRGCTCGGHIRSEEQIATERAREERLDALCAERGLDRTDWRALRKYVMTLENPSDYLPVWDFSGSL